ncbi:MAG: sodium-dependent bicarbonate transport family permease [Planctomycetes bacterium]|nr:sodium-dependent bicarbonate transport family permease [Planctomycetota bacterium]
MDASVILSNLLTPAILFFALGMVATFVRSDLEIPQPVSRALSLYLLFAIGMHGGAELAAAGLSVAALAPLAFGAVASAVLPLLSFAALRRKLASADAAAVAATYGSVSVVTFITACSFLEDRGTAWSGHMVAAMALMESPAILVGVLLARRAGAADDGRPASSIRAVLHESFLNGPVLLLVGSLAIGVLAGEKGWKSVEPFAHAPFKGVLCLFLLDMGLVAARRIGSLRESGVFLTAYAVVAPLVHAGIGIAAARALGMAPGDALLLAVLLASASYIAVPAALRIALPAANPSVYVPMALALTFPFNITFGIPLYSYVIERVWMLA